MAERGLAALPLCQTPLPHLAGPSGLSALRCPGGSRHALRPEKGDQRRGRDDSDIARRPAPLKHRIGYSLRHFHGHSIEGHDYPPPPSDHTCSYSDQDDGVVSGQVEEEVAGCSQLCVLCVSFLFGVG